MITRKERKEIARKILTLKDDYILEEIKQLLFEDIQTETSAFIEHYNREIDEAIKDIEEGNYYTQEEADVILAKWMDRQDPTSSNYL